MRFSLLLYAPEPEDGDINDDVRNEYRTAFDNFGRALNAAGVLRGADIYRPVATTTTVTLRAGEPQIRDGRVVDAAEKLGGTFVIEVADRDAAVEWARRCPGAQYGLIEVRPSAVTFSDGQWRNTR